MRSLAPKPTRAVNDAESDTSLPLAPTLRKNEKVRVACLTCRKRRTKCTAERPKCKYCSGKGLDCLYDAAEDETYTQALKRKYTQVQSSTSAAETILQLLKERSQQEALTILERLRTGTNTESLLASIQGGDLLLQAQLVPESRYRYVFPYRREMPAYLHHDLNNVYLGSNYYEPINPAASAVCGDMLKRGDETFHNEQYSRPYHIAELMEPLIDEAEISYWTNITNDEPLLKQLMKNYFLHRYQFWSYFHKDLFLHDLVAKRRRFCSSLLVNAILADACHSHPWLTKKNEPWNPQTLGYQFLAEAKRLWELENSDFDLTTIQGGLVINMTVNMDGLDKVGWSYLIRALSMAQSMGLFDTRNERDEQRQMACNMTAWALYCWQTMSTFHFGLAPLQCEIPQPPLPDPQSDAKRYSEIYFRYPSSQHIWQANHAHTFYAACQFRVIVNEVTKTMYGSSQPLTLKQALEFNKSFKVWLDSLPTCLRPEYIVLPAHLKLHIHCYDVIRTLFEPFHEVREAMSPKVNSTLSIQQSACRISAQASIFFETILRIYYLRHSFEAYDEMLTHFLPVLSSMSAARLQQETPLQNDPEGIRSSIILASKGMFEQSRSSHLARIISKLIRSNIGDGNDHLLAGYVGHDDNDCDNDNFVKHIKAMLPITVLSVDEHFHKKSVEQFLQDMQELDINTTPLDVLQPDLLELG